MAKRPVLIWKNSRGNMLHFESTNGHFKCTRYCPFKLRIHILSAEAFFQFKNMLSDVRYKKLSRSQALFKWTWLVFLPSFFMSNNSVQKIKSRHELPYFLSTLFANSLLFPKLSCKNLHSHAIVRSILHHRIARCSWMPLQYGSFQSFQALFNCLLLGGEKSKIQIQSSRS